jgi:hypothetical protein
LHAAVLWKREWGGGDYCSSQRGEGQARLRRARQTCQRRPQEGRFNQKLALAEVPDGISGEEAEKWADARLVKNLPVAVAEIEFNLRYGDDAQRERAAQKVLDATGRGKGEKGNTGTSPILIVNMGGGLSLPWRTEKVVDGEKK